MCVLLLTTRILHCGINEGIAHLTKNLFLFQSETLLIAICLTHQYLPAALQEVADVVVSFRHQMKRLSNDLLLHVLRLQRTPHRFLPASARASTAQTRKHF